LRAPPHRELLGPVGAKIRTIRSLLARQRSVGVVNRLASVGRGRVKREEDSRGRSHTPIMDIPPREMRAPGLEPAAAHTFRRGLRSIRGYSVTGGRAQ
jgi:hypothetical protein